MSSLAFSYLFVAILVLNIGIRYWLGTRQIHCVTMHRSVVPSEFAAQITLEAHQKAADYTVARTRFSMIDSTISAVVTLGFTLFGGLQWLSEQILAATGGGMRYQLGLLVAFMLITSLVELPLSYYKQFKMEAKYGFNRMTTALFIKDTLISTALMVVLVLALGWVILTLMQASGQLWWLWVWAVLSVFQMVMMILVPKFILPLFNKFTPLKDVALRERIEHLMQRVGFQADGLFVMDGSKRSAHGNAYFSGIGKTKRIVFYDTLLDKLQPEEVEAVMAHELGHFKLKHITKMMLTSLLMSLIGLAVLSFVSSQPWFYYGLGVDPTSTLRPEDTHAIALALFMLALPVFMFVLSPLSSIFSRKHEFEADAFAAKETDRDYLVSALVKMYQDNASTLTPDPVHSAFYDSHPPATIRISHLKSLPSLAATRSAKPAHG